MKNILCYGDSNTWGYNPVDSTRYDEETRWPMVMKSKLGENFNIIEDAFNGRSVFDLSPVDPRGNGLEWIKKSILDYPDIYLAVIFLGMNDIFSITETPLWAIAGGIKRIIETIEDAYLKKNAAAPKILIIAPPPFNDEFEGSQFYELSINKSRCFGTTYRELASETGSYFIDASDIVKTSDIDGSHLDAENHIKLGNYLSYFIKREIR